MKLPVQAPAVVRGSVSWPTRRASRGSTVPGIEPATIAGHVVNCSGGTPTPCICNNGVATCCGPNQICSLNEVTGACTCVAKG